MIPNSVTEIDESAFSFCSRMTSIRLPANLTVLRDSIFWGCYQLREIEIPSKVTTIERCAFYRCEHLESIVIPETVSKIDREAFLNCISLTSITLPIGIKSVGEDAFLIRPQYPEKAGTPYPLDTQVNDCAAARSYDWNRAGRNITLTGEMTYDPRMVDVDQNKFYSRPVAWAISKQITTGTTDTTFSPDDPCTRSQAMTFLYKAMGSPETQENHQFVDIPADRWFTAPVAWAVENGITAGVGPVTFGPYVECTRAQIVTFLWKTFGQPDLGNNPGFVDVPTNAWYARSVKWAVANQITSGVGNGMFKPGEPCTRGQIVTFLWKAMSLLGR